MEKENMTPRLRFPGFTDDWGHRKLGELTVPVREKAKNAEYPVYSVTNQNGFIPQVEQFLDREVASRNKTNYSVVSKYQFAYNPSRINVGSIAYLKDDIKVIISPLYVVFACTNELDKDYLNCFVSTEFFINQRETNTAGSVRDSLSYDGFSDIAIPTPSISEQKKIGEFFNVIDKAITFHQRKLSDIVQYRKAMLQKMFPKDGSKVPEVRFPGFTDDWEQCKCGDVLLERNIQHPQNDEYPLVSFTVENGVTPKTERYEREQLVKGDRKTKNYKETRLDDIVYNPANLKFGAIARNKLGNAVFSPIYVTYEVDKTIAFPAFVEMYVTRSSFIQNALQFQQGTVYERMSVNTEDFAALDIVLPSKEEQRKIGVFFDQLDNLITLHQRNLSQMKDYKKGLLQQMFV